jgi:hypothetical protein
LFQLSILDEASSTLIKPSIKAGAVQSVFCTTRPDCERTTASVTVTGAGVRSVAILASGEYLAPWILRRIRHQSSGDGVQPKRPTF